MKNRSKQNKTNDRLPIIVIGAGALLILAAILLAVLQPPQPSTGTSNTPAAQAGANIPEPQIERVTLADSKAAFDSQSAVFLDVRDPQSYAAGHVPGAVNIPIAELETRAGELNPNQWIITYCT